MTLKFVAVQVLAPQTVVPSVESDAMVIDRPSSIDAAFEMAIPFVLIKLELQCPHATIVYHFEILMPIKKSVFFRLTDAELEQLEDYCAATGRSKSDVLRELIRSLKIKKSRPRSTGL